MKKTFFAAFKMPFVLIASICIILAVGILGFFYSMSSEMYPNVEAMAWPVVGKTIVVDAGHGGFDPGAIGNTGTAEKDINLAIANRLSDILRQAGAMVVQTRTGDVALGSTKSADMKERVKIAKNSNCNLFITVQANAIPQRQYRGAQIFYSKKSAEAKPLAESIQSELTMLLKNTTRQALSISDIYVVKALDVPVIVAEVVFLSNPDEEKLLNNEGYQNRIAWGIYSGMVNYYSKVDDAKDNTEAADNKVSE